MQIFCKFHTLISFIHFKCCYTLVKEMDLKDE